MFWNKRLYWALWHIFWSYYQGKQENSGRVIYQTSSFVIHWLLFNTVVPSDMQIWRHRITPIYHITRNANVKILGVYHLKHCFSWICFSYFNSHLAMNRFCFFSFQLKFQHRIEVLKHRQPSSKYEHRRAPALLRNIQNIRICMGKKPVVSVTYEMKGFQ